jgi:hypothetical protein
MAKFFSPKKNNPIVQISAMKSKYPQFKFKREGGKIVFTGQLLIKPEFPIYKISVEYRGNLKPLVKVMDPPLLENPPHFYKSTNSLCLYHPDNFKWSAEKLIAKEIMQWSIAWIYFYQVWLEKGIWYGPEAKHTTSNKED